MKLPQWALSSYSNFALWAPSTFKPVLRFGLSMIGMRLTSRLLEYAMDFEVAYETDRWDDVQRHFAPDAKYEVRNTDFDCQIVGAEYIVRGFKKSLDGFDRQLQRKVSVVKGPHEDGDSVSFTWLGRYAAPNCPVLELSACQTLHFSDGLICHLIDEFLPESGEKARRWMESYGQGLSPVYE